MTVRKKYLWLFALMLLIPTSLAAQTPGTIAYKIDGKRFSFQQGRVEYYKNDGYMSLTCEREELVGDPSAPGQKRQVTVGVTIQLPGDESMFKGRHHSSTSDEIPTYFSWYEVVPASGGKGKALKPFLAGLDSGDESQMEMVVEITDFGPTGGMVTGTFSGKIFDEEGKRHQVADGVFSVPRMDMK